MVEVQAMEVLEMQQEAEDTQEGALRTMVTSKVVAVVHILKELMKKIHHLRFQDVILVCRIIQAQKEMATQ